MRIGDVLLDFFKRVIDGFCGPRPVTRLFQEGIIHYFKKLVIEPLRQFNGLLRQSIRVEGDIFATEGHDRCQLFRLQSVMMHVPVAEFDRSIGHAFVSGNGQAFGRGDNYIGKWRTCNAVIC